MFGLFRSLLLATVAFAALAAVAREIHVDAASTAVVPDGSEERPYSAIAAAIEAAGRTDRVLVAPGIYRESLLLTNWCERIVATAGPEKTVIDGEGRRRCILDRSFRNNTFEGFTLTGGFSDECGGGAYNVSLIGCIISNCEVRAENPMGGGVFLCSCVNCLIVGNRAISTVSGGTASGGGAESSFAIVNCTIADNSAVGDECLGGGVHQVSLYNCIVAGNAVSCGEAVDIGTIYAYSRLSLGADPGFRDRARGDYRLRPGSPCIDAGYASCTLGREMLVDLDGSPRVHGFEIDLGCYEYSQEVAFRDWTLYSTAAWQTNHLEICAEGDWELEVEGFCDWISPLVYAGSGCATVAVETAANTYPGYRTGTIVLRGAGADAMDWCDIVQAGATERDNRYFGLFVGVSEFAPEFDLGPLSGCRMDASGMLKQALRSGLWHEDRTRLLTNSLATVAAIRSSLAELAELAQPGDVVLYHHSSHGDSSPENPVDSWLFCYDALYRDTTLARDLSRFRPGVKTVVIVDACHSGGLFKTNAYHRTERDFARRLGEMTEGTAFLTAVDFDQLASDGEDGGLFTSALLEGWRTGRADADLDGRLTFLELFEYAAEIELANFNAARGNLYDPQSWNSVLLAETLAGYVPEVWPETGLQEGDSAETEAEKVRDALVGAGFPEATAAAVRSESAYAALRSWGLACGKTPAEQAAADMPLYSAAMGADDFLALDSADVVIRGFAPVPEGVELSAGIAGFDSAKVASWPLLDAAVGVEVAAEPGGGYTAAEPAGSVSTEGGSLRIAVPRSGPQGFYRLSIR